VKKPIASVESVTLVDIRYERKEDEPSIGSKFLEWCLKERIYSQRGFGSVGPTWVTGIYDNEHAARIEGWLRQQGARIK
jgi:hypothetical protein